MKDIKFSSFCFLLAFLFLSAAGFVFAEALPESRLDYLETSAPYYPDIARRNGWQGMVILKALIDEGGRCSGVFVEKTSGYDILDRSAVRAVQKWKFSPAHFGTTAYTSMTHIPIQFVLTDQR